MKVVTDAKKIEELLTRGVEEVVQEENLKKKLESGTRLRVKLGVDPTSPNIHIGRAIPILKLRDFQELGHQIIFIVGDFTSVIGDTSDKESERPMLSKEVIEENKKHYFEQVAKILDIDKVEFRYNSEWLEQLSYREIGEHADLFSVSDFIARENIKRRLDGGKRVSLREVLYPLMQGYDSVAVKADVELGGTDQRFNLLAGRVMQAHFGQKPQDILTNPLINGTDGRKMSSSVGNTIDLLTTPLDMYGKIMSMADDEIVTYFTICTRTPLTHIITVEEEIKNGTNPRDIKMNLAREIVTLYHSVESAKNAEEIFIKTFSEGGVPSNTDEVEVKQNTPLVDILRTQNIVQSNNEFRRLIKEGAIVNVESGNKITDTHASITESVDLRIGKRRFLKLRVDK